MPETQQSSVKMFLDSSAGQELKEHLLGRLNELRDISNLKEKDTPTHQAIELKAQQRAYKKLREIYDEIMTLSSDVKTKDPRDSYSVTVP